MYRFPRLLLAGLAAALLVGVLPADDARAQDPAPDPADLPEESKDLRKMWDEMADLRLSDDARWAKDTRIEDGVCTAVFEKGIFVPIVSGGKGSTPERPVGAVFFGEGSLEVRFPDKGDALAFANHMALRADLPRDVLKPIAREGQPYTTRFKRSIVLTADSQLETILRKLDPVGGGFVDTSVMVEATERGVDQEYVVTSSRGEFAAKALARNILPDRRRALQRSGMDPVEMLRFDRMVHDHFNVPWQQLRMLSEFQTEQRFHVASGEGGFIGDKEFDKWLTCFRDGIDHNDTGLRSMALAHGTDPEKRRHLVRFAGERFRPREEGLPPLPPSRIEADDAEVSIEIKPIKRLINVDATVRSTLRFRATEDNVQHLMLRLPRHEAIDRQFKILKLEMTDGTPLRYLELGVGRATRFEDGTVDRSGSQILSDQQGGSDVSPPSDSDQGGGLGSEAPSTTAEAEVSPGGDFAGIDESGSRMSSFALEAVMGSRMDLIVVLPKPLAKDEEVEIQLDWEARWPFANWGVVVGKDADGGTPNDFRPLGPTTGPRTFLPELLPTMGGTPWDFKVKVTVPPKRIDVAISGDTRQEWLDEGSWLWVESRGRDARRPAVSAGRWQFYEEEPAQGLPGVKVHLFSGSASSIEQFPGEVRRIFVFMKRFMPLPDFWEVEVFEGRAALEKEFFTQSRDLAPAGLVGIERVMLGSGVVATGATEDAYPELGRTMLARQVLSQVWGQLIPPASERDAWVQEALVEAFGYFYVRAALKEDGFEAFEDRLEYIRKQIEDPHTTLENEGTTSDRGKHFLSLTDGGSFAVDRPMVFRAYSFYVLGRMLRERIGDFAFFKAVDQLGRRNEGQRITTEQLQAAFEKTSGQDLDDFFAYWVRGGFIPKIRLEYAMEPQDNGLFTVHGCIVTDIPFGHFDMPVAVGDKKLKADIDDPSDLKKVEKAVGGMIDVYDGRGVFSVPDQDADAKVVADPFGLVLAYKRDVKKVEETTCQVEGLQ